MAIFPFQAEELFQWLTDQENMLVLDVRNDKDFARFQVESPYPFDMKNVSYYDFMEIEEESVALVPRDTSIKIVCAKEGSAKYVAEILEKHGYQDVGYLAGGIKSWGNLLVPKLIEENNSYQLYQFIRPGKASCSYGLISNNEMMVFDPSRNLDFYLNFAKQKECSITQTFETHLQADYIAGSRGLNAETGSIFYANDNDFKSSKNPYTPLTDQAIITFSNSGPEVKVLFTPGHTPGSTSFIIDNKFMVSGDTVFINSVGRPDLGGKAEEWAHMLFDTIKMIKQLNTNLIILPGHYIEWEEATTDLLFVRSLKDILERNQNIYNIEKLDDFIDFIKNNMRQQPAEYAIIRLVNANQEEHDDAKQEELDLGKNECAASAYAKQKQT